MAMATTRDCLRLPRVSVTAQKSQSIPRRKWIAWFFILRYHSVSERFRGNKWLFFKSPNPDQNDVFNHSAVGALAISLILSRYQQQRNRTPKGYWKSYADDSGWQPPGRWSKFKPDNNLHLRISKRKRESWPSEHFLEMGIAQLPHQISEST
jgi:hypothetical protein